MNSAAPETSATLRQTNDLISQLEQKIESLENAIQVLEKSKWEYADEIDSCFQKLGQILQNRWTLVKSNLFASISEQKEKADSEKQNLKSCISRLESSRKLLEVNNQGFEQCIVALQQISAQTNNLHAEIISHYGRSLYSIVVEQVSEGVYQLSYQVPREGTYNITVKYCGENIHGSPFPLRVLSESQYSTIMGCKSDSCMYNYLTPTRSTPSSLKSSRTGSSSARTKRSPHRSGPSRLERTLKPPSAGDNRSSPNMLAEIEEELLMKVGSRGRGRGQFTNPQGVCCLSDDSVVVTDSNNQCVQIFSAEGEFRLRFGKPGRGPGCIQRPTGVTCSKSGLILVADYDNKWVNVFNEQGKYSTKFGAGKFLGAKGVAVLENGQTVVIDNKGNAILFFDPAGRAVKKINGSSRLAPVPLAGPHFLDVNRLERRFYVSEFHGHSVKVFGETGEFLYQFGTNGIGNGQFSAPTGVAVDRNSNVLVADWGNNRIQIFDKSGSFLSFVNSSSSIYGPQDLCSTSLNQVVVADSGHHCFKLYKYLQ